MCGKDRVGWVWKVSKGLERKQEVLGKGYRVLEGGGKGGKHDGKRRRGGRGKKEGAEERAKDR